MDSIQIDGTTYLGGNSRDTSALWGGQTTNQLRSINSLRRTNTIPSSSHNWREGFAFGGTTPGTQDPGNFLWEYANENNALPFTQVFIRPRIANGSVSTRYPERRLCSPSAAVRAQGQA